MNATPSPVRTLASDPELHRHLSSAERASFRFAVWLLELHLRRAQRRRLTLVSDAAQRDAARRAHDNQRALERRSHDALRAASWYLGAR